MECPYCKTTNYPDTERFVYLERFLIKVGMCGHVTKWDGHELSKQLNMHSHLRWRYSELFRFLEGFAESEVNCVIKECLESLVSRRLFKKVGDEYHYIS
jgi:hypothetical protein